MKYRVGSSHTEPYGSVFNASVAAWQGVAAKKDSSLGAPREPDPACIRRDRCLALSYMKTSALTIRLDRALERQLALLQLEEARRSIMPLAAARGYLTDEDVFRAIS
jgi:hypothetical protein